jgi:Fe-S cluster assembly iron-binding protein IscA
MITVTERAAQELGAILAANATDPKQLLRLHPGMGGLVLGLDFMGEGDEVAESEGSAILIMTPEISSSLAGSIIDYIDTPEGPCLSISRGEDASEEGPKEE